MNEETESPYCEICGTCGYIGCCGIRNFIKQHIEGKTNCKNEDVIISELIDLCEYKDYVFKLNNQLQQNINNAIELLKKYNLENYDYPTEAVIEAIKILERMNK